MRQATRWTLPCLLLLLLPITGAEAEPLDEATGLELRTLVDQLVEGVLEDDEAAVDAVTCLDDLIHSRLLREEALGLIADADDPVLVEERKSSVRSAAYAFVERLVAKGQQVESTEASRVELFEAEGASGETLITEGEVELEITGAGILGVKMLALPQVVDVEVSRLRDRWCLDPLSMQ